MMKVEAIMTPLTSIVSQTAQVAPSSTVPGGRPGRPGRSSTTILSTAALLAQADRLRPLSSGLPGAVMATFEPAAFFAPSTVPVFPPPPAVPARLFAPAGARPRLGRRQQGFAAFHLLAGLISASLIVGGLGYTYLSIAKAEADAQAIFQTREIVAQVAAVLRNESSDSDSDGTREPPAGATAYSDGYRVPATSAALSLDAWGMPLLYCPFDNGTANSSTGRITGINPGALTSTFMTVISAGPDRLLQTTCATAKTSAVPGGDDIEQAVTAQQSLVGSGGTAFYGDPVLAVADLANLPAVYPGQLRAVTGSKELYINTTGAAGAGNWTKLSGSGGGSGSCASHAGETSIAVIIGTYTNAKLISGVNADGLWYYAVDFNGDGSHGGSDYVTHDFLDAIFNEDVNGVNGGGGNTNDTYRYATLALKSGTGTVRVALPTYGGPINGTTGYPTMATGLVTGTAIMGSAVNPTYDGLLAIWDSLSNTTGTNIFGAPPGWASSTYWSATRTTAGHASIGLNIGILSSSTDPNLNYVALQVL